MITVVNFLGNMLVFGGVAYSKSSLDRGIQYYFCSGVFCCSSCCVVPSIFTCIQLPTVCSRMVPDVLQMMILPVNSVNLHHSFKRFEAHFVKASRTLEGVKQFVGSLVWYMNNNRLSGPGCNLTWEICWEKKNFRSRKNSKTCSKHSFSNLTKNSLCRFKRTSPHLPELHRS